MGRYTGSRTKLARRFGEPIFGPDKVLDNRPNPPGQHGANKKRKKLSEYGVQLREKQKAKAIYGMREGQFRLFFDRSKARDGFTKGDAFLALCECRLDNIVYRLGLSPTRPGARQLVTHRHVTVDGKICNVPSRVIKPGEVISIKEKSRDLIAVQDALKSHKSPVVNWLSWDDATMQGSLLSVPMRAEIPENIEIQLIVEFFSR